MKLTIKDRIILQAILIKQGGLIELNIVKNIIDKVAFTSEEISCFEMKDTELGTSWNPMADEPVEINFSYEEIGVLKKSVAIKDEAKEILIDMLAFCNMIMQFEQ